MLHGVGPELGHLGGSALTIITTVGPLALDVSAPRSWSTPRARTAVSHIFRAHGIADTCIELLDPGGLDGRSACGAASSSTTDRLRRR